MSRIFSFILLLTPFVMQGMHVQTFVPHKLGSLEVLKKDNTFYVKKGKTLKEVQNCDVDPQIRKMDKQQLAKFLKGGGRLSLSQFSNGDYKLKSSGTLKGGGPILAGIGYWGTKALCYGAALAAGTAAVTSTGGAVATVAGGSMAAVGTTTGTAVVAGGLGATTTGTAIATTSTAAVVGTAGCVTKAIAFVESAATFVGALGASVPFL